MPGGDGNAEAEFLAQRLLHFKTLVAERSQRTGSPRELADQHARLQLLEALGVAVEHPEINPWLVAGRHPHRPLHIGAAPHPRIALSLFKTGASTPQCP